MARIGPVKHTHILRSTGKELTHTHTHAHLRHLDPNTGDRYELLSPIPTLKEVEPTPPFEADPYSATMHGITDLLTRAYEHNGSMSEGEYAILGSLALTLAEEDEFWVTPTIEKLIDDFKAQLVRWDQEVVALNS